jgi:carbon monoxide dehydrogenase subunit G
VLNRIRGAVDRPSCYVIDFAGGFLVSAPAEVVWSVLEDVKYFDRSSPWLENLIIEAPGLRDGSVLQGTITTPLPYRIRLTINFEQCVPPCLIVATVHGDLAGEARLSLIADGQRTRAELRWTIEMMQRPMRAVARLAHPALRRGHDTVVQAAIRALTARAVELDGSHR